jgi:ribonuclease HII
VVVRSVPAAGIDRYGLHRSNLRMLGESLEALDPVPDVCLTDGFGVPACSRDHVAIVDGDEKSAAIAAASIVAKVTRDRFMHRMAAEYPLYGFDSHVGYITPDHVRAVRAHGVTPLHRRSFVSRAYDQLELSFED